MDAIRFSDGLLQKLQTLYSEDFLCDTIVTVGQQSLKAHGVMLAAVSPFFKEALKTNTEPGLHVIDLTGCDFDVLEIAVRFIYTGRLEVTEKYAEPEKLDDLVNSLSDLGLDRDHLYHWDVFKREEEEEEVSLCKETSGLSTTVDVQEPVHEAVILKDTFIVDSELQPKHSRKRVRKAKQSKCTKGSQAMKTEQDAEQFSNPLEISVISNGWVIKGKKDGIHFRKVSSGILNDKVINKSEIETLAINSDASLSGGKKRNKKANLSGRSSPSAPEEPRVFPPPSTELPQAPSSDFSENTSSREDESCHLSEAKKKRQIPGKRPNIVCSVCNKVFSRADRFKIHQRIHTGDLPYSCEYCGKKFAFGNNLKRHVKSHTGEKPYLCHFCGCAFIQKATLDDHIAIHSKEREHMCNFCGKFFKSTGYLRVHSRVHRGLPPRRKRETAVVVGAESSQESSKSTKKKNGAMRFACQICQKDYANKISLTIHMRQHSVSFKPFKCTSCEKTFLQRAHRDIHERSHSGFRPYSCTLCGKTFTYSAGLKLHTRLHTGEKPYKCDFCGSCYTQQAHLRSHIRTHTGEKPFECKACGKKYRNKVDLRFHHRRNPSCVS